METITINLDLPPEQRWSMAAGHRAAINELMACYLKDIEDYEALFVEMLPAYQATFIPSDYLKEIEALSAYCDYSVQQVLFANLYYDIVKFAFACTAYACWDRDSIWHARNLDWWTDNDALKKHTKIFNYTRGGVTVFQSVGWVGFVGVLSGYKPHYFALTLNAIISDEAPNIAKPVTFLLRELLEGDHNFASAKKALEETEIVCDCLLLLSGTQPDEMVVIERTPTQSATRTASDGCIVVTNDYKVLSELEVASGTVLNTTSCGRFDQTKQLLQQAFPSTAEACYQILNHKQVKMGITVQQMVFNACRNSLDIF